MNKIEIKDKNHTIYINDINYTININIIKNKKTLKDLIQYLQHNNNSLHIFKNYFILYNSKLISHKTPINSLFNDRTYHIFELIERQKGGGLADIISGIIQLGKLFLKIGELILWFLKFIIWWIQVVFWILYDFLNPVNFINDFFQSLLLVTVTICRVPLELILASFKIVINIIGGWMQGFWGWDMSSLTKADKNSNYFSSFDRTAGQKIYYTQQNTVPFSIILGTILCPPMGVFMDLGTTGWLNIIVCALLTLLFYLPGLCYALLIIYS